MTKSKIYCCQGIWNIVSLGASSNMCSFFRHIQTSSLFPPPTTLILQSPFHCCIHNTDHTLITSLEYKWTNLWLFSLLQEHIIIIELNTYWKRWMVLLRKSLNSNWFSDTNTVQYMWLLVVDLYWQSCWNVWQWIILQMLLEM